LSDLFLNMALRSYYQSQVTLYFERRIQVVHTYQTGYQLGCSDARKGNVSRFVCIFQPIPCVMVREPWQQISDARPVESTDLDYARGYLDGYGRTMDVFDTDYTVSAVIRVSYAIVTHESAESGDYAETGWEDEEGTPYTFREAVKLLQGTEPSSTSYDKRVWYMAEAKEDLRTGDRTEFSYHIDASDGFKRRLYRAVTAKMIGIFR
jgi:hypothetical protein